jgi:hypothetical protein
MSNTLLTPTAITREALRVLHNEIHFVKTINRQHDNKVEFGGQKAGGTIQIRKPPQYNVRTGATIDVQDSTETQVSLNVNTQKGVDLEFSSTDLTLSIDDFSDRFIKPAMSVLASNVDFDALSMTNDIYQQVGTFGTTPASAQVYLDAQAKLDDLTAPRNDRCVLFNPQACARTVDVLKALFNAQTDIAKQYKSGMMGANVLGADWYMSQNVRVLTTGSRIGTILVDGAPSEGASIIHMDGFTNATDTISEGEVFTVAGVYQVNPETKQSTGKLQQFTVTADFTAASNEGDVSVSPAMYSSASGALQNISALPANDAAVSFMGNASAAATDASDVPLNLLYQKDAFTFATANLQMPQGVDFAAREVMDGLSMRIVRDYDINNDTFPCRLDILYGYVTQRPEYACRIMG